MAADEMSSITAKRSTLCRVFWAVFAMSFFRLMWLTVSVVCAVSHGFAEQKRCRLLTCKDNNIYLIAEIFFAFFALFLLFCCVRVG